MLLEKIREEFIAKAAKRRLSGTPSASRLGGCTASMEMLLFPDVTHPEGYQPRAIMVFEDGDRYEEALSAMTARAYPGLWGLRQQPFYFRVPMPDSFGDAEIAMVLQRLRAGPDDPTRTVFWGWPEDDFMPPSITAISERRLRVRGIRGPRRSDERPPPSVILDQAQRCVWVIVNVDGVVRHPVYGLTVVEFKSMSTYAFRRALLGEIEYRYRCQLAAATGATEMASALWLLVRKETMHLTEISFHRDPTTTTTTIKLTAPSGKQEVFLVADRAKGLVTREGSSEVIPLPADSEWETAAVTTPFDPGVLPSIYARIWRVLMAQEGQWHREYGPDFRCRKCAGLGTKVCVYCNGTGFSKKSGKPCGACAIGAKYASGLVGQRKCQTCEGAALLDVTELSFPCTYCASVMYCWRDAGVVREIDTRPHYRIARDQFLASGITFTPPEAVTLPPPEPDDEPTGENS